MCRKLLNVSGNLSTMCTFRAQVILILKKNALEKFNFPCLHFIITSPKLKDDPPEKNCIENHTFLHRKKKSTRNFVVGNENFPQSVKSYAFLQGIIVFSYSFFCDFILIIFVMTMTKRNSRPLGKFAKKNWQFL